MSRNSTDATQGLPLGERTLLRIAELEAALDNMDAHRTIERDAIELALGSVRELITGDLAHPSETVAADLNLWLERHKYLAEVSPPQMAPLFDDAPVITDEPSIDEEPDVDDVRTTNVRRAG